MNILCHDKIYYLFLTYWTQLTSSLPVVRRKKSFHKSTCFSFATRNTIEPTFSRIFQDHSLISHVTKKVLSFGFVSTKMTSFASATRNVSTKGSWGVSVFVGTASDDREAIPIVEWLITIYICRQLQGTSLEIRFWFCSARKHLSSWQANNWVLKSSKKESHLKPWYFLALRISTNREWLKMV